MPSAPSSTITVPTAVLSVVAARPMPTEGDTCRRHVLPRLYSVGWTDEQICEQTTVINTSMYCMILFRRHGLSSLLALWIGGWTPSAAGGLWRLASLRARLTALRGLDCYCFHYTQLRRDTLQRPVVKAIVLRAPSPSGMLKCGDMRVLKPGEPDPNPKYVPGRLKEWGFSKIRVVKRDPLFEGLGEEFEMLEQHVSECQALPDEFELLASNDLCRWRCVDGQPQAASRQTDS